MGRSSKLAKLGKAGRAIDRIRLRPRAATPSLGIAGLDFGLGFLFWSQDDFRLSKFVFFFFIFAFFFHCFKLWQCLWKMVNKQLDFSNAYRPQIAWKTEVVNCALGDLLSCLMGEHVKSWDQKLC